MLPEKVRMSSRARGKGGLTPSEGVRPQFCKARCSLYHKDMARDLYAAYQNELDLWAGEIGGFQK